jgi:hypothetical protein
MLYRKIDKDGYFIEDIILNEQPFITQEIDGVETQVPHPHYIITKPEGLYRPRFVDGEWVEGLTDSEIETLKKPQRMAEIQARLHVLDIKTFKFIDGDLTAKQYEPYKQEKIALRKEYNALEQ